MSRDHPKGLLALAWLALLWERLWPLLWPVVGVLGLFVALALADLFAALSGLAHSLVLGLFGLALVAALGWGWWNFRSPVAQAAARRLEADSGLAHRPLSEAEDRLAAGADDPLARELWVRNQMRRRALFARLRLDWPRPGMARIDPWGLRALVVLALALGLGIGGRAAPERLARALVPEFGVVGAEFALSLWITPPAYTGLAPIARERLPQPGDPPLAVPVGSALLAVLHGVEGKPELRIADKRLAFSPLGGASHRVEGVIEEGSELIAALGRRVLARYPIRLVADQPPTVAFAKPPDDGGKGRLRIAFKAADDYGVAELLAVVRRPGGAEAQEFSLAKPGPRETKIESAATLDLAAHPWAGLAVEMTLIAKDGAGQLGQSEPIELVLPERRFNHPVAAALAKLRKELLASGERRPAIEGLLDILARPDRFGGDRVAFLALSVARWRLLRDARGEAIAEVAELLWQSALRIEDGTLGGAELRLAEAERELREAIDRNAPADEIERLAAELRRALDEFLAEMARRMAREGSETMMLPPDAETLDLESLRDRLGDLEDLARLGARDRARQLLDRLARDLDALRRARPAGPLSAEQRQAAELGRALDRLRRAQQELLDRTLRRSQEANPRSPQDLAEEQAKLRKELGEAMRQLGDLMGEIPEALGEAERAMREAEGQLGRGAPGQALAPERRALDKLGQGLGQAMNQMGMQFGRGLGLGLGQGQRGRMGRQDQGTDPFGRQPGQGAGDDDRVKVPPPDAIGRAREILEELRRRAGEPHRPALERDYIERLLRRF